MLVVLRLKGVLYLKRQNQETITSTYDILNKADIMRLYKCESDKALKILKIIFQMGFGIKIGKEYYVTLESHKKFLETYAGKEVII